MKINKYYLIAIIILIIFIIIQINNFSNKEPFKSIVDTDCQGEYYYGRLINDYPAMQKWLDKNRRFNDVNEILSQDMNYNVFNNSNNDLWEDENVISEKDKCYDYKNVNQCMTKCKGDCMGFYFNGTKCCMMSKDKYDPKTGRINFDDIIQNRKTKNKGLIYKKISDDKFIAPLNRVQCRNVCTKCIIGKCPDNYRCVNLEADPRYNHSCIIENNKDYDELIGNTFDSDEIPNIADVYGLNDYAGYRNQFINK